MSIQIKKKENESIGSVLYQFNKRVRQSGILKEVRKRRAHNRPKNKRDVRLSALHRAKKAKEVKELKKYGKA